MSPPAPPAEPPAWAALARRILGARWLPVAFALLVVGGVAALPLLSFDFSPQTLFDSTSERARVYTEYRAQYGADDHVLIALVEADLAKADSWALIADLEDTIAEIPSIDRTASVLSAEVPRGEDGSIVIAPLPPSVPTSDAEAAALLAQAKEHPLLRNTLVAPSGAVGCVVFKVADDVERISDVRPLIDQLRALLDTTEAAHPGATLHLLGPHAYRATVVGVMVREELRFAPLTALLLALVRPAGRSRLAR